MVNSASSCDSRRQFIKIAAQLYGLIYTSLPSPYLLSNVEDDVTNYTFYFNWCCLVCADFNWWSSWRVNNVKWWLRWCVFAILKKMQRSPLIAWFWTQFDTLALFWNSVQNPVHGSIEGKLIVGITPHLVFSRHQYITDNPPFCNRCLKITQTIRNT